MSDTGKSRARPRPPAGVKAVVSGSIITLQWDSVDNGEFPVRYQVYRKRMIGWKLLARTSSTAYKVNGLDTTRPHEFSIKAVDADGLESDRSKSAKTQP